MNKRMQSTSEPIKDSCAHCGKPVYPEQGYYSITYDHYDCYMKEVGEFKNSLTAPSDKNDKLKLFKTRKKIGEGKLSLAIEKKVTDLLEEHFSQKVIKFSFWIQPPCFRGENLDLAKWGAFVTLEDGYQLRVHSWASMGLIKKRFDRLKLLPDGGNCFEL